MKVLITGSNRGIGLALTQEYLEASAQVIATTRNIINARELKALEQTHGDRLTIQQLDITTPDDIEQLERSLSDEVIDILINNAGVKEKPHGEFDSAAMNRSWQVNVIGTLRVTHACLPALYRGNRRIIVNVSTVMASIRSAGSDNMPYRVSKAALNMATRMQARQLSHEGFCIVALHPGWVRTDMGGASAPVGSGESARAIMDVVEHLTVRDTGRFIDAMGKEQDLDW
jgi:NAD(P)-dependent dehydrogenase (short-subunit alcohol dehydrogenase family)